MLVVVVVVRNNSSSRRSSSGKKVVMLLVVGFKIRENHTFLIRCIDWFISLYKNNPIAIAEMNLCISGVYIQFRTSGSYSDINILVFRRFQ